METGVANYCVARNEESAGQSNWELESGANGLSLPAI